MCSVLLHWWAVLIGQLWWQLLTHMCWQEIALSSHSSWTLAIQSYFNFGVFKFKKINPEKRVQHICTILSQLKAHVCIYRLSVNGKFWCCTYCDLSGKSWFPYHKQALILATLRYFKQEVSPWLLNTIYEKLVFNFQIKFSYSKTSIDFEIQAMLS